jgi:hypothetical protein
MIRIAGQEEICLVRAATCRRLANDPSYDEVSRRDFEEMAIRWMALARSYKLAEEISAYLAWQAQRVEPPPGFTG